MTQLTWHYIIIYDTWFIHEIEDIAIATSKLDADHEHIISAYTKVGNIYLPVDLDHNK